MQMQVFSTNAKNIFTLALIRSLEVFLDQGLRFQRVTGLFGNTTHQFDCYSN